LNTKPDYSSDIKFDFVKKGIPELSYVDPSNAHNKNVKGKHTNLVFHLDTIAMNNANSINQLHKDSFYSKPCLLKLTMRNYHPTLYSAHYCKYPLRSSELVIRIFIRDTEDLSDQPITRYGDTFD
jgi:hypothetical protein